MPGKRIKTVKIEKAKGLGFCPGVKRAIEILEKVAREHGKVETLGAVVHNPQVLQRLAEIGVRVARDIDEIRGNVVVTSSHGVSPQLEKDIRSRHIDIVDTTCPFVRKAQVAAQRLVESGFFVIIFGDINHPEVKGILGQVGSNGVAALDDKFIATLDPIPRHLGILSQTTQIPANFNKFAKKIIDTAFVKDSELRIIDTICHDIRERQEEALNIAKRVGLILVVGGHNSANTNRLAELCSAVTKTYRIETAEEVQPSWLEGIQRIGITSGASTADHTIEEVMARLKAMTSS